MTTDIIARGKAGGRRMTGRRRTGARVGGAAGGDRRLSLPTVSRRVRPFAALQARIAARPGDLPVGQRRELLAVKARG
jgi:hypothetical protein